MQDLRQPVPVEAIDCKHVTYKRQDLGNIDIAANLYLPPEIDYARTYAAIPVSHPGGGVKEQCAATYARRLAEAGFITLAFDASYQGQSGGEPRGLDDGNTRAEDIVYAINYLQTLPFVDSERIGVLGICAGGGPTMKAACLDHRIKAFAGVSVFDVGAAFRAQFGDKINQELDAIAKQKTAEAQGWPIKMVPVIPDTAAELPKDAPEYLVQAVNYYRTPRAYHPGSTNRFRYSMLDRDISFHPYDCMGSMVKAPLLLISGSKSDTHIYSQMAYEAANCPKEMFRPQGATHVDLYDVEPYITEAIDRLSEFFIKHLGSTPI